MSASEIDKPKIKSNWWSLLIYVGLILFIAVLLYIPLLIAAQFTGIWDGQQNLAESDNVWIEISLQADLAIAVIYGTYLMTENYENRGWRSLPLTWMPSHLLIGVLIGVILMCFFVMVTFFLGLIDFKFSGFTNHFYAGILIYSFVAVAEEVMFRGYVLTYLQDKLSTINALIVSSLLFGLMHLGNDHVTLVGLTTISLSGFLMGLLTLKSGTISAAIGMHLSWNFVQGSVFGLAVSGHNDQGIFTPKLLSASYISGGEFGAEGSILMLILSIISIFAFYRYSSFFGART